jgi:toxin ParE1/3/4
MRTVNRRRQARRDVLDIFMSIDASNPQAAERFLLAFERTLGQLASRPGIGVRFESEDPRLADLRICTVTRFKSYLVFYRMTEDQIEVIRVLHGARGDIERLLGQSLGPT